MAAIYAGLEIVERNPHYVLLPYINDGFDATVWFDDENSKPLDMKFENTPDGYAMPRKYVADHGEIVYNVVLHKDTYEALESESGEKISMTAFEPAPVNP